MQSQNVESLRGSSSNTKFSPQTILKNVGGRTSRDANYVVPRPKHLRTYASSVRTLRMFGRILQHSLEYKSYKQHHRKLLLAGGNGCADPLTKSRNPHLMGSCSHVVFLVEYLEETQ
jgi:hypothetical protein